PIRASEQAAFDAQRIVERAAAVHHVEQPTTGANVLEQSMRLDRTQRLPRLEDGDDGVRVRRKHVALRPPLDAPTEPLRQLVEKTRTLRARRVRRQARVAAATSYFFRSEQCD